MKKDYLKLIGYLLLIWSGYIVGQYPYIPSVKILGLVHIQPTIEVYDKCIAFALLTVYTALWFALHHYFWVMISLTFMAWGMFNNFVDEMTNKSGVYSTMEQLSLLMALLTTSILVWKHRKK